MPPRRVRYPTDNELLPGCCGLNAAKGKTGNRIVDVMGGEGGLLWALSYQSPPHNNVFGQRACYARCKTAVTHTLQQTRSKVSPASKNTRVRQ